MRFLRNVQVEMRSLLSPVVCGFRAVLAKVVLCGTSLSLEDVKVAASSVGKPVGQLNNTFSLVMDELKPWTRDDFRVLLRNCLKSAAAVDKYDLPDELFPGNATELAAAT